MKLKVLQWNIWEKEKIENVIKVIKEIDADVVCLQGIRDFDEENDMRCYSDELFMEVEYFMHGVPAYQLKNGGMQHNFIMTKNEFTTMGHVYLDEMSRDVIITANDGKSCAYCEIELENGKKLEIATVHLSNLVRVEARDEKQEEIDGLIQFIEEGDVPLIIAGELNIAYGEKYIKQIEEYMNATESDNVFVSKNIRVDKVENVDIEYSDHLPVLVEVYI